VLAIASGAAFGGAQGRVIDLAGLPPFVVTLGGMFFARGVALAIHVESLPIEREAWRPLARCELPGLGLDLAAAAWLGLACALAWSFRHARTLRAALAIGGDERTALYFGVSLARTKSAVYALSGACAAASGAALALYASKGDSTAGVGLELDAIAAAVIGGTSLRGGRVSVLGAVLGALVLSLIRTVLDFEGVGAVGWMRVALGALLLAFFVVQRAAGTREAELRA
jgi:simple sugar transport system permease protein